MKKLLIGAVLVLVASACGSGTDTPAVASLEDSTVTTTVAPVADAGTSDEDSLLAFAACMRDNGVDIPDPTVDADGNVQLGGGPADGEGRGGRGDEEFGTAIESCGELLDGITLGFGRGDATEFQDTLLEFAACMRDNGVDMPDPDFSTLGGPPGEGGGPFGELDREGPTFVAAQDVCSEFLDGFGPAGGGRGPAGGNDNG